MKKREKQTVKYLDITKKKKERLLFRGSQQHKVQVCSPIISRQSRNNVSVANDWDR
jgi:hypothetical protein